jgi:hypothetical protein
MNATPTLEREEYIEQAYFFHTLRERLAENQATQEIINRIDEEILSTTRLPYAIQFLATELNHSGLLSSGFARLSHYFTPFQTFVVVCTELENRRFSFETALLVLEREASYRTGTVTPAGLFFFQLEVLSRNRLGYDDGIRAMMKDALFDETWRDYLDFVRQQLGLIDIADLVYLRSDCYVKDERRNDPDYQPPLPPLLGEKEGRIARATRGRDPLYLFAALQRHLGYPDAPRPKPRDDAQSKIEVLEARQRELEKRLKLLESEVQGQVDLSQFGKPELLKDEDDPD